MMLKRRLKVRLTIPEHEALADRARIEDMTIANLVRKMLGWPPEDQGHKRDRSGDQYRAPRAVTRGSRT